MEEVPSLPDDVLELGRELIPAPAFLVGCARSGTSIFGEALAADPRVHYLFEISKLWNASVPEGEDHRLLRSAASGDVARAVYKAFESQLVDVDTSRVILEKNPKHVLRVGFLDQLFPHAKFLHIIRDGRDVVTSLMFRNRGDRWGHLETPGWSDLMTRFPEANHIRCAHQWKDAVTIARAESEALGDRMLEVRYEELLADPRAVVTKSLEHLDLDLSPEAEAFFEKIQDDTAGSYHARKQVRHFVENHKKRVGRFEENLTPAQVDEVLEVCGGLLSDLGYV